MRNLARRVLKERIIKHKFNLTVPAYMLASSVPGEPVPVKRYVSCPIVSFEVATANANEISEPDAVDNPFLGADDPTLPIDDEASSRRDMRKTGRGRVYPASNEIDPHDPALLAYSRGTSPGKWKKITGTDSNGHEVVRYVRIKSTNKRGETVLSDITDLGGLSIVTVRR